LALAIKRIETEDIEVRLSELERAVGLEWMTASSLLPGALLKRALCHGARSKPTPWIANPMGQAVEPSWLQQASQDDRSW